MAEIKLRQLWNIELTTPEIRLVLRSLGGRITSEQEENEARELGDFLTKLRMQQLKQQGLTAEQLSNALEGLQSCGHDKG